MLVRLAERIPGGRLLVFALPFIVFAAGSIAFPTPQLIQICNWVSLALTVAVLFSWRRMVPIFLRERHEAGAVWLSLGIFAIVVDTVVNIVYSSWLRAQGTPPDITGSYAVAVIRFGYVFGFGCLYLVPFARDAIVPPNGWISLIVIVALSIAAAILGMWWF